MSNIKKARWIRPEKDYGDVCPIYRCRFNSEKEIKSAGIDITAMGVYEAYINGDRIGDFIMAPGWTAYDKRHQYQTYDITEKIKTSNEITITVGKGWYRGDLVVWRINNIWGDIPGIIAVIKLVYTDGSEEVITTDNKWEVAESPIRFSEIYDGEVYDASYKIEEWDKTKYYYATTLSLIPQEGEIVREQEHIKPVGMIITPKGEKVIDFGQNMTGYVKMAFNGKAGDKIIYSHAETLDSNGNFYTENLRSAKQRVEYICCDGMQEYKPHHSFMGFRYIRIDEAPDYITCDMFEAIVVHSEMERTGYFECSNEKVNKLYRNIIWGHKGNFLDIPTDCPQRDERLGWTADAQIFIKTATYNYNVEKFFNKWLMDLICEQREDGSVPTAVPDVLNFVPAAGWGDAATICPWQIYLSYGNKDILERHAESMMNWVEYIHSRGEEEFLWIGDEQMGDWLGLDAEGEDTTGASDVDLIASAYFAYSTELLVKSLRVLGRDAEYYENMHKKIVSAFHRKFTEYKTQTECAIALAFNLAEKRQETADKLVQMIKENDGKLTTGFLGTPHLMDALSENGYVDVAYSVLLREEYPSWLFSVNMGATTIWEHWDSIKADGSMWNVNMNSLNHYAFGCVGAWMYETMCGIKIDEENPGFEKIIIAPKPDKRLKWAKASVKTRFGTVVSGWKFTDSEIIYELELPKPACVEIENEKAELDAGKYTYRFATA